MAIQKSDVQRIVEAHARVRREIEKGNMLSAGQALCEEFRQLLAMQSFWQDVRDAAQTAQQHRLDAERFLEDISLLVEEEAKVFAELGVGEADYGPILADVFEGISEALNLSPNSQLVNELQALQADIADAAGLLCEESEKGRFAFAYAWVMSEEGKKVLGDVATIAANASIVHGVPHLTLASMIAAIRSGRKDAQAVATFVRRLKQRR